MRLPSGDARSVVFAPLDEVWGRSEAVARRLGSAIAMGLFGDGEQLPPEQALALSLNVSTVTLREALSDLRAKGLVETRRGRGGGSFVKASPAALASLSRRRLAELGVADLRELGDVRAAVAGTAARLAAERASQPEIARLRELVERLRAAHDEAEARRIDGRYFIELAAAAQSARLTLQEVELQGELAQLSWPRSEGPDEFGRIADRRTEVVEAIAGRDAELARSLTEGQLAEDTRRLIEEHIALTRSGTDKEDHG